MSHPLPTAAQAKWLEDCEYEASWNGKRYHSMGYSEKGPTSRYAEDWVTGERVWLKDDANVVLNIRRMAPDEMALTPEQIAEENRRIALLFPNRPTPIDGTAPTP